MYSFYSKARVGILLCIGAMGISFAQSAPIVHDPVVIKEKETFHLFCTGTGITHLTSTDLKNWEKVQPVFAQKPTWTDSVVPDFKNHIWAPDVLFKNGMYYLFYSVSAFAKNTSAIGVATSKSLNPLSPDYGFTDHGILVQSHPNRDMWNAIDPNLVFDENNTAWMAFGSFWDGLKLVKLDNSLLKMAEPQEWYTIARRERSFDLPDADPGDAALEAPFIFKKEGYYYLFLSWDLCCRGADSTYKVVVGRSKSVTGPYLDANGKDLAQGGGTLVIQGNENWYGVGHNSAYSFDGTDFFFSHAYDAHDNGTPKLVVKEMEWKNGWPIVKPMD